MTLIEQSVIAAACRLVNVTDEATQIFAISRQFELDAGELAEIEKQVSERYGALRSLVSLMDGTRRGHGVLECAYRLVRETESRLASQAILEVINLPELTEFVEGAPEAETPYTALRKAVSKLPIGERPAYVKIPLPRPANPTDVTSYVM